MSVTPTALSQIAADIRQVKDGLNSNRLFDLLDYIRDEVRSLSDQNARTREAIDELHKAFLQSQASSSTAAD